jgi:hypothetical protein
VNCRAVFCSLTGQKGPGFLRHRFGAFALGRTRNPVALSISSARRLSRTIGASETIATGKTDSADHSNPFNNQGQGKRV